MTETKGCPSRWDDEDAGHSYPCQLEEGHPGNHQYTIEWDDEGDLVG